MNAHNSRIRTRITRLGAGAIFAAIAAVGVAGPAAADSNGDGTVSGSDYLIWQRGHGAAQNDSTSGGDYAVWRDNFGSTSAATGDYDFWRSNYGATQ